MNETMHELQSQLAEVTNASVEWVYDLGLLNFLGQVKLMQSTDVMLTVHGAELSNAIFLRRSTRLIEL